MKTLLRWARFRCRQSAWFRDGTVPRLAGGDPDFRHALKHQFIQRIGVVRSAGSSNSGKCRWSCHPWTPRAIGWRARKRERAGGGTRSGV
jgi:hypothetical protein